MGLVYSAARLCISVLLATGFQTVAMGSAESGERGGAERCICSEEGATDIEWRPNTGRGNGVLMFGCLGVLMS